MKNIRFIFISMFILHQSAYAGSGRDTIAVRAIAHRFNADFTAFDSIPVDTTLKRFQIYNPPFTDRVLPVFLGNLSQPYLSALYKDQYKSNDFLFSQNVDYNFHKPEDIVYFKAWSPYTRLCYFTAGPKSKQEQKLSVLHSQSVTKNFNVGFLGDVNYSDGQFINQRTKVHDYSLFSSYQGNRYRIYGSVNLNTLQNQENGGILDEKSFNTKDKAIAIPVNLEAATANVKNQTIFLFHRFYLTGSYKSDSLHTSTKWNEAVSLIHQFKYERNFRGYNDLLTKVHQTTLQTIERSYYKNVFIDSTKTHDTVFLRRFDNTLQLAINANQWLKVPAELRFGLKNQIDKYGYGKLLNADSLKHLNSGTINYKDTSNNTVNTAFVASLTNRFSKTIRWGASLEYYFIGYKTGDKIFSGDIEKSIWGNFILKLSGILSFTRPSYFLNDYESNHIRWHNDFKKQQSSSLRGGLYLNKFKFSIEAQNDILNNYVYFDTIAKPAVANAFSVSSISVNKLIDWGVFHTDIRATFQNSSNDAAIPLPNFSGFNSTYLEFNLFKKVMKVQFGLDIFYNSAFYAKAYMPVTGQFYSQHNTRIGNYQYPFTNVFLNIKVKRLRFSIGYERINTLLNNDPAFFLPQYPYNPGILKYGLSWTFYD